MGRTPNGRFAMASFYRNLLGTGIVFCLERSMVSKYVASLEIVLYSLEDKCSVTLSKKGKKPGGSGIVDTFELLIESAKWHYFCGY